MTPAPLPSLRGRRAFIRNPSFSFAEFFFYFFFLGSFFPLVWPDPFFRGKRDLGLAIVPISFLVPSSLPFLALESLTTSLFRTFREAKKRIPVLALGGGFRDLFPFFTPAFASAKNSTIFPPVWQRSPSLPFS